MSWSEGFRYSSLTCPGEIGNSSRLVDTNESLNEATPPWRKAPEAGTDGSNIGRSSARDPERALGLTVQERPRESGSREERERSRRQSGTVSAGDRSGREAFRRDLTGERAGGATDRPARNSAGNGFERGKPLSGVRPNTEANVRGPVFPGLAVRRRPVAAAASALLVVVSAAIAAGLYGAAGHKASVLAVAREVAQGATISEHDLRVVRLSPTGGVATIPASMAARVLGRRSREELTPGMLLSPDDVGDQVAIAPGDAVVGLALKDGQLPAGGIAPGDPVMVVFTNPPGEAMNSVPGSAPAAGSAVASQNSLWGTDAGGAPAGNSGSGPGTVLVKDALVTGSAPVLASSSTYRAVVSVEVPGAVAGTLASAAAAGQVSLVLIPPIQQG